MSRSLSFGIHAENESFLFIEWLSHLQATFDQFNDWGGGRGYNIFVPVLGGNGTKVALTGDIFDQPLGQMR